MKNNKGFTLIELLAVIVILGVIAGIAIPSVSGIINDSKKKTLIESAKGLVETVKNKDLISSIDGGTINKTFTIVDGKIQQTNTFTFDGALPENGTFTVNASGQVKIAVHNSNYCVTKNYTDTDYTVTLYNGTCTI